MGIMADRAAANRLLGRVEDPNAHGRHAVDPRTERVTCGSRAYKDGYAPCQLATVDIGEIVKPFMPSVDRVLRLSSGGEWVEVPCDDCGRTTGHDPNVEH